VRHETQFPSLNWSTIVIRYCCDRCKRDIDTSCDLRYTVTIEIDAAVDGVEPEMVDDPDHLDGLQDLLDSADDICSSVFSDEIYQRKQFDLCKDCFRQYIKNPLAKEPAGVSGFSKN
jgi:hypothetical protein